MKVERTLEENIEYVERLLAELDVKIDKLAVSIYTANRMGMHDRHIEKLLGEEFRG